MGSDDIAYKACKTLDVLTATNVRPISAYKFISINRDKYQWWLPFTQNDIIDMQADIKLMRLVLYKGLIKVKGKGAGFYSLISSLKTYHRTWHFTPWSLDLFIHVSLQLSREYTVLQPFRRIQLIVHIAISVPPGTHFHLSEVKQLRVKCLAQGHTILTISQDWEGKNMIFLWKSCTKRDSKPHGRQRHRQSATL